MKDKPNVTDLINLFPLPDMGVPVTRKKTKRSATHTVNPTYKPPKADMSPAEWKRMMRKRRNRRNRNGR